MLNESTIKALEEKGFSRWTKGNFDRLYISASTLGLECGYYKTGNIKWAEFDGERISNSQGYRYKAAKTYIDVKTGRLYGGIDVLKGKAQQIMDEIMTA